MAIGCLVLGMLGFFAWKDAQTEEVALSGQPSRVALGRYATTEGRFRILPPIANPANVTQLTDLAVALEHGGEIIALRVVQVPEQMPLHVTDDDVAREHQILEKAHAQAYDLPMTSLVRVGHNVAKAILETARERNCDLIILGWKGYSTTAQKILGEVTDSIVNSVNVILLNNFCLCLAPEPSFTRLSRCPDGEIMATFLWISNKLFK